LNTQRANHIGQLVGLVFNPGKAKIPTLKPQKRLITHLERLRAQ
jgi:hypothetical protein